MAATALTNCTMDIFGQGLGKSPIRDSGTGDWFGCFINSAQTDQLRMARFNGSAWSYYNSTSHGLGTSGWDINCISVVNDGTTIHVAVMVSDAPNAHIFYMAYTISTNTWSSWTDIYGNIVTEMISDYTSIDIERRSDGDLIIMHTGTGYSLKSITYTRVSYTINEGSGWSSEIFLDDGATIKYDMGGCRIGESDTCHFVFSGRYDVYHKSLTSGNTLSSSTVLNDNDITSTVQNISGIPVYYDDAGVERMTFPWVNASGYIVSAEMDDEGTPSAEETVSDDVVDSRNYIYSLAVDASNKIVYCLYTPSAQTILKYDTNTDSGGWGTDIQIASGLSVAQGIGLEFYNNVLYYIYAESSQVYWDTLSLASDETLSMGAATLASSPQALSVGITGPQTIKLGAISLASSPQAIGVNRLAVVLGTISLDSSAQGLGASVTEPPLHFSTVTIPSHVPRLSPVTNVVTKFAMSSDITSVSPGDIAWSDLVNAQQDDLKFAYIALSSTQESEYLRLDSFGFTDSDIPTNAEIKGFEVSIVCEVPTVDDKVSTMSLYLKEGIVHPGGEKEPDISYWPQAPGKATRTYGGPTDLWGWATATPAKVKDSEFGVDIVAESDYTTSTGRIYAVWMRIYYEAPPTASMSAVTLASSLQTLDASTTGASPQTIEMGTATLAGSPQALTAITVGGAQAVPMGDVTLASSSQVLDLLLGAVSVEAQEVTLASSPQALTVDAPAPPQTVELGDATLASSSQTLDVVPGVASVSLDAIALASSPQTATVIAIAPQTVPLGATTLASAAQELDVIPGASGVQVDAVSLVGSAQGLGIIPGAASAQLGDVTLASAPQALTVIALGVPQTIPLYTTTLESSALNINAETDQAVSLGAVTLASVAQSLDTIPGACTVPIQAATLVATAQALDIIPGATSIPLSTATLVSAIQAVTVAGEGAPQTVELGDVTLQSNPQSVNVETDQIVEMGTATLAGSAPSLDVIPGIVTIQMGAVTLVSWPRTGLVEATVVIDLSMVTLVSSVQALDIITGAVSADLGAITLISSPQSLDITVGATSIELSVVALAGSAQALDIVATGAPQTVAMGTATLASSAQGLAVETDQMLEMGYTSIVGAAQALDVVPGAVTVQMGAITLVSWPRTGLIKASVSVDIQAVTLASSAQALDITTGAISVNLGAVTLASSPQSIGISIGPMVHLSEATLVSSPQGLDIIVGATSVELGSITLVGQAQSLALDATGAPQAIEMSDVTLVSSAQSLENVATDQIIQMGHVSLAGSSQALDVSPGGIAVQTQEATLASGPQALNVQSSVQVHLQGVSLASSLQALDIVPGSILVLAQSTTLVSSAQDLTALGEGAPQTIEMSVVTLESSGQALDVAVDQVVVMGTATLVGSAQALDVVPGNIAVPLGAASLVSSAQGLDVIPGAVAIPMQAATLESLSQSFVLVSQGAPLAIPMVAAALASSAEALKSVAVDQIVGMGYTTLASSAQAADVIPGTVYLQMAAISLDTESQTLSVVVGIAPVTIEMAYAALISGAQSIDLVYDQVLSLGQVALVAVPQDLTAIAGPEPLTIYLDSISSGLSLVSAGILPGEVRPALSAISLVSGIQNLTAIAGIPPDRFLAMVAQSLTSSAAALTLLGGTRKLETILRMSSVSPILNMDSGVATTITRISSVALEEIEA